VVGGEAAVGTELSPAVLAGEGERALVATVIASRHDFVVGVSGIYESGFFALEKSFPQGLFVEL
jgi:hypothetical protein